MLTRDHSTRPRRGRWATAVAVGALITFTLFPTPAQATDGAAQFRCEPAATNQPCPVPPGSVSTLGDVPEPCERGTAGQPGCGPDYGVPGLDGCWYKLTEPTTDTATALAAGTAEAGGVWYVRTCGHGPLRRSTLVRLAVAPVADLATLARHARLTLRLPEPVATVHTGPDLVGWPTWLWLPDQSWRPVTATATAGAQTATVTATPTLAVWQTGDGSVELCSGSGTARPEGTDATEPSPDCGHVYAQRLGRATPITVTVLWTVVATGGEREFSLPPLSTTMTTTAEPAGGPAEPDPTP